MIHVALSGIRPPVCKPESIARVWPLYACGSFRGKASGSSRNFDKLRRVARRNGPITVLPEKTRIAFQVRMSLAAFVIRRTWIDGHVGLARRFENPRFRRIETFSPRNHLHAFRFESVDEVDAEVSSWLTEAYQVGRQRHLMRGRVPRSNCGD